MRVAELEIDPAQLDAYKIALKEEMDASVRLEPGVIGLFAVAEKDNPARIRILELYADEAGYQKHLLAPHFLKYKNGTQLAGGHFNNILNLTRCLEMVSGP